MEGGEWYGRSERARPVCEKRLLRHIATKLSQRAVYHMECREQSGNCETQPPASIGWVALSSLFVVCLSRIGNTSSHLHYMMFQTIQTIYFLWGYDPGNMSVSFIAELSPVYCCLVKTSFYPAKSLDGQSFELTSCKLVLSKYIFSTFVSMALLSQFSVTNQQWVGNDMEVLGLKIFLQ